ncbi:hypothetical protein GWK47_047678 [Chionoecetes opilio]|uniref:Uncharacterized protein n=1 Tax=Chionoecetes opilio TaxID=41210 RepID=A0A8J5CSL3_CHIOP|nr:hypothetical protein GWK47_047678 [Chionoecetes opilio]
MKTLLLLLLTGIVATQAKDYNTYDSSYVHYSWGLDYQETLNDGMQNRVSSLRYAGSQATMNEDGFNLYEGVSYTKKEFYGNHDIPDMTKYHEKAVSIIIIGGSSWTFCEDVNYYGHCACLRADQYDSNHYGRLDVGLFPDIHASQVGIYSVRSVRKGCHHA